MKTIQQVRETLQKDPRLAILLAEILGPPHALAPLPPQLEP